MDNSTEHNHNSTEYEHNSNTTEHELHHNSTSNSTEKQKQPNNKDFKVGFVSAFSALLISEFGDKTFFIAAILAISNSRLLIFNAAMLAYLLIGLFSCAFGKYSTKLIPTEVVRWIAMALFFIFSLQMFWAFYYNDNQNNFQELQEVEEELGENKQQEQPMLNNYELREINNNNYQPQADEEIVNRLHNNQYNNNNNNDNNDNNDNNNSQMNSFKVFSKCFWMIFLAEWGDKSQITQVAMSASYNAISVYLGSMLAMALITLLAVFTGKLLAQKVSERNIQLVAAFVFLAFAINMLFENLEYY